MKNKENTNKEDAFQEGYFWEYYRDLERQFLEYLNFVPYIKGNEKTYSYRLANLLLSTCAHIDSAFKEIGKSKDFVTKFPTMLKPKNSRGRVRQTTIMDYYPIELEYSLSERKVLLKTIPERMEICPFAEYTENCVPSWWTSYNKIKHNFTKENFKRANLKTVRDALAGAFLLNVVHKPAVYRLNEYGEVHQKYGAQKYSQNQLEMVMTNSAPVAYVETAVFLYDYDENPSYK